MTIGGMDKSEVARITLASELPLISHLRRQLSLRLGHAADLTVPRTVIQHRVAASLPPRGKPHFPASAIDNDEACNSRQHSISLLSVGQCKLHLNVLKTDGFSSLPLRGEGGSEGAG